MANEIAVQFYHRPAGEAAQTIASHIQRFWAPGMVRQLIGHADNHDAELDPLIIEAVKLLR
jgi:formate dehydrogenase subunit delta